MKPITKDIKVGDKVVTRDGRKGRVICTDIKWFVSGTQLPIVVCLDKENGDQTAEYYYQDGRAYRSKESGLDIFQAPKKEKLLLHKWVNGDYFVTDVNGVHMLRAEEIGRSYTYIKTIEVEL